MTSIEDLPYLALIFLVHFTTQYRQTANLQLSLNQCEV